MSLIIPFILGIFIAAIGIFPPGMLNMTVAKLSISESKKAALWFAFGSVILVFIQCFVGVYFAKYLDSHQEVSDNIKKFGVVIFILLTIFFIYNGLRSKKPKIEVKIENKKNRFWYGVTLSSFNMFAIPYYAFVSLTLASKDIFSFTLLSVFLFAFGAAIGTFGIFYLYAVLFKKIEDKVHFLVNNINFLIATVTGLVTITSLYKLFFA